jgi:hypothetical protein
MLDAGCLGLSYSDNHSLIFNEIKIHDYPSFQFQISSFRDEVSII